MSVDGESGEKPLEDDMVERSPAIATGKISSECEECSKEQLDEIEEDLADDDEFGDFEEAAPTAAESRHDLETNEYEDTIDVPSCSRSISCDSQTQCNISDVINDSNLWVFDELPSQTETTTDDSSDFAATLMEELEVCDIFQKFDLCDGKSRDHQCLRDFQIESLRLWTLLCYVEETAALKFLWNKSFAYNLLLDALQMNVKKEKAIKLAELMQIPEFKASEGWLDRFKKRQDNTFKTEQGEAGAVDSRSLQEWQQHVLQPLLKQFSADDIFNLDETGLFWQLLPNKTMAFRRERCAGGKKSKERITLLVGANMSGKEKFPLLVIGKSERPRAFKNKEIPLKYKANSKAWMTAEIFEGVLRTWDGRLGLQKRKVLLFLDNLSGHPPTLELDNIRIAFFPPNTTAKSQPMDQGIIENLKRLYKKLLLRRRLEAMEEGIAFKINLLDALHFIRNAWERVTKATIRNCFAKAKFTEEISVTDPQNNCLTSYSQSYFPVDASLTSSANPNWAVAVSAASNTFEHSPLPDASIDSLSVAPADFDWKTSGLMNPLTGASIGAFSALLECDFFNSDNPNCNGKSILERDLQDLGLSNGQNECSSTFTTPTSNILPVNLNQLMQNGKPTTTTTISSPSRGYKRIEELPLEAQALHNRLPDLQYMLAGHLMFPLNNHHQQEQ